MRSLGCYPGKETHFSIRREKCGLHGDRIWVRRDVVQQDKNGRLSGTHEIARDREDEIGIGTIHLIQESLDHRHSNLGPAGA